jgi:hypothetical protein
MIIKKTIGVLAKNEMAHASDTFIESARELGMLLKRDDALVLAAFSGAVQYVKEALLASDGSLLSLSPACSKEEHETVFRHSVLPDEKILYTGLGRQLTVATVVRSADVVIALDEGAYDEAKMLSSEEDIKKVYILSEKTKDVLQSLF